MAQLTEVTTNQFDQIVLGSAQPVLVDFWATWCGPCKALGTKLEEVAGEFTGQASIVKVNIEENPEIAARFSVRGVPAMLLFKGGEVRAALHGNQSKEAIVEALQSLI